MSDLPDFKMFKEEFWDNLPRRDKNRGRVWSNSQAQLVFAKKDYFFVGELVGLVWRAQVSQAEVIEPYVGLITRVEAQGRRNIYVVEGESGSSLKGYDNFGAGYSCGVFEPGQFNKIGDDLYDVCRVQKEELEGGFMMALELELSQVRDLMRSGDISELNGDGNLTRRAAALATLRNLNRYLALE